jgi:nitrite reductase (NADH) small subunit
MMIAEWLDIGWVEEIPVRGSRVVRVAGGDDIAVFRTGDGQVFALRDRCPHKRGRLSQGIVHGGAVACPLHNWRIALGTGEALGEDRGCTPTVPVKIDAGRVLIQRAATLAAAA